MLDKKKKKIIGAVIIAIILIMLIVIFVKRAANIKQEDIQTIELTTELLNVENIEDCEYETDKTEEQISSKYYASEKYEIKANVKVEETGKTEGKIIYVRGNYDN